jgi:hypothetical protein
MNEKFNKETEILKKNQTEILSMTNLTNQIKTQLYAQLVDLIKWKKEYQGLKTSLINYLQTSNKENKEIMNRADKTFGT